MPIKLTYKFVKKQFEKENYKLLSERYKNAHQKLNYICPNNHKHSITWNKWQQGRRCARCATDRVAKIKRLDFNVIKKEFEKEGYILLTTVYINAHKKLNYICPNKHKHSIKWNKWQQGERCPYCVGNAKLTIGFIKKEFEKEGYKLLTTTYINSNKKLDYFCPKGHQHHISWDNFRCGHRCPSCFSIKITGSGHHMWKGGVSCDPYCDVWVDKEFKKSIKDRDGNVCLNTNCRENCNHLPLTIHHIDYNKKNCGSNNLITLCRSCNARANKDREWHMGWYSTIMYRRYGI